MDAVVGSNQACCSAVAFAREERGALCKFYGFFYRFGLNHNQTSDGFLDVAKRAVGYYCLAIPCSDHPGIVKWKSRATDKFVLGSDAIDPVHGLLHPFLHLFG